MLLEEDVAMNVEDIREPPRPLREVPPPQPREPDRECGTEDKTENETPWVPLSPPPAPWPRVFPGL
jgi:hypothetical protein